MSKTQKVLILLAVCYVSVNYIWTRVQLKSETQTQFFSYLCTRDVLNWFNLDDEEGRLFRKYLKEIGCDPKCFRLEKYRFSANIGPGHPWVKAVVKGPYGFPGIKQKEKVFYVEYSHISGSWKIVRVTFEDFSRGFWL